MQKLLLQHFDNEEWNYTGAVNLHASLSAKSTEFIAEMLGKRPHPDQQHEMGPHHKSQN